MFAMFYAMFIWEIIYYANYGSSNMVSIILSSMLIYTIHIGLGYIILISICENLHIFVDGQNSHRSVTCSRHMWLTSLCCFNGKVVDLFKVTFMDISPS